MMYSQYTKYGILSGFLLIYTIISGVTADSQNSVFAQITPAAEKHGSNDDATMESSHDTAVDNDNSQGITPSEKLDGSTEEEVGDGATDSTNSNGANSEETAPEQDDEIITNEEQDPDPTSQLVEAIMSEVNEALSASGIFSP
jgi:cytoskeletal protein RodZ